MRVICDDVEVVYYLHEWLVEIAVALHAGDVG